jgi:hypothetical protein
MLTTRITELEKLQENKLEVQNNVGTNQWSRFLWNQQKNTEKKFQFGNYVLWFRKGEKTHMGKFKKRWFGPFMVQYFLPNNIVFLVVVNNFEPNPLLVNVNKLKPYTYMDQTLKGIHSSEDQKSLRFIDEEHMEERSNEKLEVQGKTKTIGTNQIVVLEKTLVNLISQQVMNKYSYHDYANL